MIYDKNGKALERLSLELPSNSVDNWHTASELVGWGTPGMNNSQFINTKSIGEISVSQPIFSPNNDGYQDVLSIDYNWQSSNNLMYVEIFSINGRKIRELKDNFYPGTNGVIVWDGLRDDNTKANIGTYIILVTVFDLEGNINRYKMIGVLADRI